MSSYNAAPDTSSKARAIAGVILWLGTKVVLISGQVNSFQYGDEKFNVIGTKKLTIA